MDPAALIIAALLGLALGALLLPLVARLADRPVPRWLALILLLAAALVMALLWIRYDLSPHLALTVLYAAVLLACAGVDLAARRIPNALIYPALALLAAARWSALRAAGLAAPFPGLPVRRTDGLPALVGGALVGGLFLIGYFRGWNGLGDAKLGPLVGLILGFPGLLSPLAVGLVAAGLVAGELLIARKQWAKVAEAIQDPQDALVVEGYPAPDPELRGIAVFTLNVTTKKLQAAKRQGQAGGVG
jgi:leader peptidase (prepilin peptidase)/N-methyltransferase